MKCQRETKETHLHNKAAPEEALRPVRRDGDDDGDTVLRAEEIKV